MILTTLYLAGAENTDSWRAKKGDLQRATPLDVLMAPSSSISIIADDEHLACGGFSLGKPIRLGNFEFIANYFGGLCLSPGWGNEGTVFEGSTHSGESTPQWATFKDSTEEFLTVSSGEGSFNHPSPRWRSMGARFALTATTSWKENAPAMTRFPPRMDVPQPEANHTSGQHHADHEEQPMQARARRPTGEPGSMSQRSQLAGKQSATTVQPDAPLGVSLHSRWIGSAWWTSPPLRHRPRSWPLQSTEERPRMRLPEPNP
jgi:hypothetical protein